MIVFLLVSILDFKIDQYGSVADISDANCQGHPLDGAFRLKSTSKGNYQNTLVLHSKLKRSLQALEYFSVTGF